LFNVLRGTIADAIFVDLFAGTGSVGLEALSYGASQVYFVEHEPRALQVLRANIQHCAMAARATVVAGPLPQSLGKLLQYGPVDIIFLDPPYATDLGERTLTAIGKACCLSPQGMVIWQHAARHLVPEQVPGLWRWQSRRYGDTQLSFYRVTQQADGAAQERAGNEGVHAHI
jgi:16S rRNA (guanine(966)-N(2))-methyltransferase RsmD